MERLVAVCQSKADQQRWVDNLSHHSNIRNGVRASGGGVAVPPPALPTKTAGGGSAKNLAGLSSKASGGLPTAVKGQPPLPPHKQQPLPPPPQLPPMPKGVGEVLVSAPTPSHVSGCLSACAVDAWDLYDGCYSDTYDGPHLCGPPPEGGPVAVDWYCCCDKGSVQSGNESGEGRLWLATEKSEFVYMNPNKVKCRDNSSRFPLANEQGNVLFSINSIPETAHTLIVAGNPFFLEDEPFVTDEPDFVEICVDCDLQIRCQNIKSDGLNDSYNAKCNNIAPHCSCLNSSGAFLRFLPDPLNLTRDQNHRRSGSNRKPPYPHSYDKRKEPYVVLTRYFRKLYRRKVITRAMLRALSGDLYDLSSAAGVALRRKGRWQDASDGLPEENKDEDEICLVLAGDGKSDQALCDKNEQMENGKDMKRKLEEFGNLENVKKEWEREHSEGLLSPIPVRKVYNKAKDARVPDGYFKSNLHKWKYSPYSDGKFSSMLLNPIGDSSSLSKSSNPYGLTNFFSADDSDNPLSCCDKRHTYTKDSATTCGELFNIPVTVKQASLDSAIHPSISCPPIIVPKILMENICSDASSSAYKPMYKTYVPIILKMPPDKLVCESENYYEFPLASNPMNRLTSNPTFDKYSGEERVCADPPLENMYDIVTNSSSAGNICNKTIYERGSSEEEACRPICKIWKNREYKSLSFFKKKPCLNFYFSSCSAEDTEEDQSDFYASCREFYSSFTHTLSKSEPNIYYKDITGKPEKQYASHYVQFVCHVGATSPDLKCRCETFSHRSSDSGMVDVHFGRHVDDCPFKSDVTLGSNIMPKLIEHSRSRDGSCPDVVSRSGILAHPCPGAHHLPCKTMVSNSREKTSVASNINSTNQKSHACCSSIVVSTPHIKQLDAKSVPPEDTATQSERILAEEQAEIPTYKSGLYAHWWMKATISPEDIRSCALSKHIAEIAMTNNDAYFKGKSSKASFHAFKPEKQIMNDSRYGRGQHVATQEVGKESLFERSVLEQTGTGEYSDGENLAPKHVESLHWDPSYESFSSQMTIRCNALPSGVGSFTATSNASVASDQQSSFPCPTSALKQSCDCDPVDPCAANTILYRQTVSGCLTTAVHKPSLVGCPNTIDTSKTDCIMTTLIGKPSLVDCLDTTATSKPVKTDCIETTPISKTRLVGCPNITATSKPANADCLGTKLIRQRSLVGCANTPHTCQPVKADFPVTTHISQRILDVGPMTSLNSMQAVDSSHGAESRCKLGCCKKCAVGVSIENGSHVMTKPSILYKPLHHRQKKSYCGTKPERLVLRTKEYRNLADSRVCCRLLSGSAGGGGNNVGEGGSSGATVVADTEAERLNNPINTENVESECASNVGYEHSGERDGLCWYTIHVEGEETLV